MPDDTRRGVLRWESAGTGAHRLVLVDGVYRRRVTTMGRELVEELRQLPRADLDGVPVDYEWKSGQLRSVRPTGTLAPSRTSSARPPAAPARMRVTSQVDVFRNPYTFVPAPARDRLPDGSEGLGDGAPAGHDRLRHDRWTGQLGVRLTTVTPLLALDTTRGRTDAVGHTTYDPLVRADADGRRRPHLPTTTVKGMLRAGFEAVTNSRLGVFAGHDAPLGYRSDAAAGLSVVPARITSDGAVQLYQGTSPIVSRPSVMYAAWLPRYGSPTRLVRYPDGKLPEHGEAVRVRLRKVSHHKWDGVRQAHVPDFQYWLVTAVARVGQTLPRDATGPRRGVAVPKQNLHSEQSETIEAEGWVCVTGRTFPRKHDERVFFGPLPETRPLTDAHRQAWTALVRDYRDAHRHEDVWQRRPLDEQGRPQPLADAQRPADPWDFLGRQPGRTAWSRHLWERGADELRPGDLCYARLNLAGTIEAMLPVMIARELHGTAPAELLHPSLRPAASRSELSPADRVFGWVDPTGNGAHRGQLRVGPVRCERTAAEAVVRFGERGVPLAVLSAPKPQQGRFYLADGSPERPEPLPDRTPRGDWYASGQSSPGQSSGSRSLRGRKVYPHHAGLPDSHWDNPTEDRTQMADPQGHYQEYRRPNWPASRTDRQPGEAPALTDDNRAFATAGDRPEDEARDDQNRSVTGWVKPGTTFRFTIDVRNLSDVELGGLLWLLSMPEGHVHRVGTGKPLGFGSVRLDVDQSVTELRQGRDWAAHYRRLTSDLSVRGSDPDLKALVAEFESACEAAWPGTPHLAALRAAAKGDAAVPVHYPRVRPAEMDRMVHVPPDPRGRSYEWFVQNDAERASSLVRTTSLPPADGDPLPVHPAPPATGSPGIGSSSGRHDRATP